MEKLIEIRVTVSEFVRGNGISYTTDIDTMPMNKNDTDETIKEYAIDYVRNYWEGSEQIIPEGTDYIFNFYRPAEDKNEDDEHVCEICRSEIIE